MASTTQPPFPVLRNRVGEVWRRRDGQVVTITRAEPSKSHPYAAAHHNSTIYHWYDTSLRSCLHDHNADLVELIRDPRACAPEYITTLESTPTPAKSCNTCAAWEQLAPQSGTLGRCIRHAPILLERTHYTANWPTTCSTDYCFDFIAKPPSS